MYNNYQFNDGSLSEQYLQLSNFHITKIKEYEGIIIEHSNLCKNLALSSYETSTPYTYNQLRSEISTKIKYNKYNEDLILQTYSKTHDICHRLLSQLKRIAILSKLPEKTALKLQNLSNFLENIKKHGRQTLFTVMSDQGENIDNSAIAYKSSKKHICDQCLKIYPNNMKLSKLLQHLIKTVIIIKSPVIQFILNSDIINSTFNDENPTQILSELMDRCLNCILSQLKSILETSKLLLLELKDYKPSDNESLLLINTISAGPLSRRNSVWIKNTSSSMLIKKKMHKKSSIDIIDVKSLKEKMKILNNYHKNATRSINRYSSSLTKISSLERRLSTTKDI